MANCMKTLRIIYSLMCIHPSHLVHNEQEKAPPDLCQRGAVHHALGQDYL